MAFLGLNQFRRVGFKICVGFITGTPKGSPKVVFFFMEKPGIKHANPGLQGIALIHYTTAASFFAYSIFVAFLGIKQFRRVG